MDSITQEISACREDIIKSAEDKKQIEFEGAGYHFRISKDPQGPSYCGCSGRLLTTDCGAIRLYQCEECGARLSVCVEGTSVEARVGGVTSEDVARVSKAIIDAIWDRAQERDTAAFQQATRLARASRQYYPLVTAPIIKQIRKAWWDIAQICENGDVINATIKEQPSLKADFCPRCSARTITVCQKCGTDIRGQFHSPENPLKFARPAFCHHCGAPYPWTESLERLKALARSAKKLSASEQETLAGCFDDLTQDTSNTQAATNTLKRYLPKIGKRIASEMKDILIRVAAEVVRDQLGIPRSGSL